MLFDTFFVVLSELLQFLKATGENGTIAAPGKKYTTFNIQSGAKNVDTFVANIWVTTIDTVDRGYYKRSLLYRKIFILN